MKLSIVVFSVIFVAGSLFVGSAAYCGDTHEFHEPHIFGSSRVLFQSGDYEDPEAFCKKKMYDFARDSDVIDVSDCGEEGKRCISVDMKNTCVSANEQCRVYSSITCGKE